MAIRLTLLRHHYRSDWEWDDAELWASVDTLAEWRRAFALHAGAPAAPVVEEVLAALADDLDAPRACAAIDAWVDATLGGNGMADVSDPGAADAVGPSSTLRSASSERASRRVAAAETRPQSAHLRPVVGGCAVLDVCAGPQGADSAPARPAVRRLRFSLFVSAALEVPLELAGDGLAGGLGELGGVAGLLEGPDVLGDVLVLLGELVDAALPGAGVLGEVAERDADLEEVLDPAEQGEGGLRAGRLRDVVGHGGPVATRPGCRDGAQASWKTPTMPVGPSYVDSSSLSRSTSSGSVAVPVTGTGRVCGVSASSAPRVTTIWPPRSSAAASSSAQNCRQRMFGSMPRIRMTSRCRSGGLAIAICVLGQVMLRWPRSSVPTSGRLTWKS